MPLAGRNPSQGPRPKNPPGEQAQGASKELTAKTLTAGDEVESQCLKCKAVTNHTIMAVVEGKVAKVLCKLCGSRHNFRPAGKEQAAATRTPGARSRSGPATPSAPKKSRTEARFDDLLGRRDIAAARDYDAGGTFKKDEIINHSRFGLGLITEVIKPNKIAVLFREGAKILICRRVL